MIDFVMELVFIILVIQLFIIFFNAIVAIVVPTQFSGPIVGLFIFTMYASNNYDFITPILLFVAADIKQIFPAALLGNDSHLDY